MSSASASSKPAIDGPVEPPEPQDPREAVRQALAISAGATKAEAIPDSDLDAFLAQLGGECPKRCALFDIPFYLGQLPPRIGARVNPVLHYAETGAAAGLLPHPVFDGDFVRAQLGTAGVPVVDARDWLAVLASRQRPFLSPHPLFDPETYLADAGHDAATLNEPPILLFLRNWATERARFSPYFDIGFYLRQVPHLRAGLMDPLSHYLLQPDIHRLDPNPMVHGKYYQNAYSDVGADALSHYIRFGLAAGREPNPYAPRELGELGMTARELDDYIRTEPGARA